MSRASKHQTTTLLVASWFFTKIFLDFDDRYSTFLCKGTNVYQPTLRHIPEDSTPKNINFVLTPHKLP
jgi:hypothetical protein